jgi:hypothetical protein
MNGVGMLTKLSFEDSSCRHATGLLAVGSMGIDFTLGLPPAIFFWSDILAKYIDHTSRRCDKKRNNNLNSKVTGSQNSCQT